MMFENVPFLRGLSSPFGLSYVPGSWMQSIQVSKGTSSVINGYESMTGQINIEYKKPDQTDERLFVNLYGNDEARAEANIVANTKLTESLSTMLMLHTSTQQANIDHNKDGFLDAPKSRQINVFNRWLYQNSTTAHTQLGIGIIDEIRTGGQVNALDNSNWLSDSLYKAEAKTKRYQAFLKSGFMFDAHGVSSLGFQASGTYHQQESFFGLNTYTGTQKSLYSNLIFQSEIGTTSTHKYSTGISYQYDDYNEQLADTGFMRTESVPGAFIQYTFDYKHQLSIIAGARADINSKYGTFFTPRLHLRYEPIKNLTFRASAGKGYRTASIIAENMGYLASSRKWIFNGTPKAEEAWNFGMNLTKTFELDNTREAVFTLDFYRTSFINQVVTDLDQDVHQVVFYNLEGESFSNSFQAELTVEPFTRFNITAAFRYNDVKLTLDGELKEKPFVNKHKGLLTLSYSTRFNKWQFDFTTQYNGVSRLPDTEQNPPKYRRAAESPRYFILHSQITRRFKHIDVYAGGENLGGYVQHHPVIGADEPYGKYFDSSM
jgi:outer membrane receptor protein involved in Fe transport